MAAKSSSSEKVSGQMASPATPVLRVKRRRSQSPAGALVLQLSAKRRKASDAGDQASVSSDSTSEKEAVFKLTATVDNPKDTLKIVREREKSSKSDPKLLKRILAQSKTTKADADKKDTASAAENRYKVVAALRGLPCESGDADGAVQDESSSAKKESDRLFKLVDVVKEESKKDASDPTKGDGSKKVVQADQIVCNGVPLVKLDEEEYVYDVYTMENSAFSSTDSDRSLMADDFDAMDIMDVRLLDCRDLEHDNDEVWNQARFNTGEDSDSNDEDNWRNDYPDELSEDGEENDYYYREEDLDLDFNKFHLRHGNREIGSSPETSDEDEEGLVYSRDANFDRDADLHGSSYAKYKRKILRDMGEDPEEHEIEGFDDDEDDINQVDEY